MLLLLSRKLPPYFRSCKTTTTETTSSPEIASISFEISRDFTPESECVGVWKRHIQLQKWKGRLENAA